MLREQARSLSDVGHREPEQLIGRVVRHLLAHSAGEVEVEPLSRLAVVLELSGVVRVVADDEFDTLAALLGRLLTGLPDSED